MAIFIFLSFLESMNKTYPYESIRIIALGHLAWLLINLIKIIMDDYYKII